MKGLLGGRVGLEVAPVARTTILEYFVPVDVCSVKIDVRGSKEMHWTSDFCTRVERLYRVTMSVQ